MGVNMMRKLSWVFLLLLVFWVSCEDPPKVQEPPAQLEVVVGSAEELKEVTAKKVIWKKDGSQMVLIPAGSFQIGDAMSEPDDWMERSRPVHTVELDGFYMDVNEVTVEQFKKFVQQSGYSYNSWNDVAKYSPGDNYPMIYVTWNDATAYAKWAGKRLSTEKEWEWAARGGLKNKEYPWGDDESKARDYANYKGTGGKDKWGNCASVGSFKPNGYGLFDMAGNVWEWCQDWSSEDQKYRVLRGGNWINSAYYLRVSYRNRTTPINRGNNIGFRCVVSGSP